MRFNERCTIKGNWLQKLLKRNKTLTFGTGRSYDLTVAERHISLVVSIVRLSPSSLSKTIMTTSLDLLKQTGTVVVSDSGDFECGSAIVHPLDHALIFW